MTLRPTFVSHWRSVKSVHSREISQLSLCRNHAQMMRGNIAIVNEMEF
jgi:hypothetical protein